MIIKGDARFTRSQTLSNLWQKFLGFWKSAKHMLSQFDCHLLWLRKFWVICTEDKG